MSKGKSKHKGGRPKVDDERRFSFTIAYRIPPDIHQMLKELAKGESVNQVARDLLIGALKPDKPKGLFDRIRGKL